jgi:hypothetical protein
VIDHKTTVSLVSLLQSALEHVELSAFLSFAQFHFRVLNSWAAPANPSINTDWRDKAAPAGYVKR